jgi:Lipopolysaccharide-assembly
MNFRFFRFPLLIFAILFIYSCKYSFSGINIPNEMNTFYIEPFELLTTNAEPTITIVFTETLSDKILTESKLRKSEIDPDYTFSGAIINYRVTALAPQPGETSAFNRLEITVKIVFVNSKDEEENFEQSFPFFNDFPSQVNILDIQDELINNIFDQIVEDIFNKAFTGW